MSNYDLKNILGQLNQFCVTNNIAVKSVYDAGKGLTLQDLVYYLLGVVRDCVDKVVENNDKFEELYKFVNDFFNNLDLQDEVNKKLEEMLESGELEELLNNSIGINTNYNNAFISNSLSVNNMFPDITKFNGKYYCAFRSGTTHASFDGVIMLTQSEDGYTWSEPIPILTENGVDYRDPYLNVIGDKLYLSLFSRANTDPIVLTGYIYDITTGIEKLAEFCNLALFSKLWFHNGQYMISGYNDSGSYIYTGTEISNMSLSHTFTINNECCLSICDNKLICLFDNNGITYYSVYTNGCVPDGDEDIGEWTEPVSLNIGKGRNIAEINGYYYIGYRNAPSEYWYNGESCVAIFTTNFNKVHDFVVRQSETGDCGYFSIYNDEDKNVALLAHYYQSGTSESLVETIIFKTLGASKNIFTNVFSLNNTMFPHVIGSKKKGFPSLQITNMFNNNTTPSYTERFVDFVNATSILFSIAQSGVNPQLLLQSGNLLIGTTALTCAEFQRKTGGVLFRQSTETRGTANIANALFRRAGEEEGYQLHPYLMDSGDTENRPSLSDVPSGYLYYDTTLSKLLVNIGGTWFGITTEVV